MKTAYFDCFSGASGDMILGALLDAGVDLAYLRAELAKLHLTGWELQLARVLKGGIRASRALVVIARPSTRQPAPYLRDIEAILQASALTDATRTQSLAVFRRLAEAEARVHGQPVESVHFHEVGALDAIIDVVGAVTGLQALGVDKVLCSPLHLGTGTVQCLHGLMPVPAPATAELIRGVPCYAGSIDGELLTPTGAAILTTMVTAFGPLPAMNVEHIGYGAGTAERRLPNVLRLFVGGVDEELNGGELEQVAVLETTIDDMNPQIYDHLMGRALEMGALDIFLTPVQMKKNRPGTLVTLLCAVDQLSTLADLVLRETTSLGLRWRLDQRFRAVRAIHEVDTECGRIRCKIAQWGERVVNVAPEYEDCKRVALERQLPLKVVFEKVRAALAAASPQAPSPSRRCQGDAGGG